MNFKNLILFIAIIVVLVGAAAFLVSHRAHPKQDCKIEMISQNNLTEGDNFTVKLTDINGSAISNQNISITIIGNGNSTQKNLTTNSSGHASFKLDGSTYGNCAVKVKYSGNDKFNGCNFTANIKINKKVIIIQTNQTNLTQNTSYYRNYSSGNSNYTNNSYRSNSYYDGDIVTTTDRGYYYYQ